MQEADFHSCGTQLTIDRVPLLLHYVSQKNDVPLCQYGLVSSRFSFQALTHLFPGSIHMPIDSLTFHLLQPHSRESLGVPIHRGASHSNGDPHKHSHVYTSHILTHAIPTICGHSLYDA